MTTTVPAYTLTSAYIDFGGRRVHGIEKISWTEAMEGAELVYGASISAITETSGVYKATCEFEILWSEFETLINRLGPGYMMKRFNVGAQVSDPMMPGTLSSLFIPQCRIIDASGGLERKVSTVPVKCTVLGAIERNGVTAIASGAFSGGTNTIGGSASVVAQVGGSLGFTL